MQAKTKCADNTKSAPKSVLADSARVHIALQAQHILTVIDAPAYHPHWPLAQRLADHVLYVSDGRPDALANAVWLLSHDGATGSLLLNRGGLAAKLALPQAPLIDLPDVGRAASTFGPQLGQRLMPIIYPGWRSK